MRCCRTARYALRSAPPTGLSRAASWCPHNGPRNEIVASKVDEVTRTRTSAAEWVTHRERGCMTLLRIMTFLSLRLGRSGGRVFLYLIAAYFFTFAPTARRHARAYLRRALGREPTAAERLHHG